MNQKIKEFILDLFFPKFCVNCKQEGFYLCPDCFSLIEILDRQYCPFCENLVVLNGKTCQKCRRTKHLKGLYCAVSYDNFIVKKLLHIFKYEPFVKDLSEVLAFLIINHLNRIKEGLVRGRASASYLNLDDFVLIPVPVHKRKLKFRGFNPAKEIAKHLSNYLKIPLLDKVLIKIKETPAQTDLKKEERLKNLKGVFSCLKPNLKQIINKKILLVDDVFTTGSTMEECALVLKQAGAKEVWGIVAAKG